MPNWYSTGTVSVTNGSTAVTGSGTAFVANVRVGDGFVAPDDRLYQVAAVNSNTSLTLARNYLGTTQSGQIYQIQPTAGIVNAFITSVQSFLTTFGNYAATTLVGLFPAGSASAPSISRSGDTNTGMFFPAADQIGHATGGTRRTLLSSNAYQVDVPITGTAAQANAADATAGRLLKVGAQRAALGADVYGRGNIVGTVSQSGGVPTGALVERGSNANGAYSKFACGYMRCTFDLTTSASAGVLWTYPAEFVDSAHISGTVSVTSPHFISTSGAGNGQGVTINGWANSGGRVASNVRLTAEGYWF